jgi:acetyl-CoA carboxylase biotin carboxyl carrier protein
MDMNEIRKILELMDANKLVEFEYEEEGKRIRLRRPDLHPGGPVPGLLPMAPASAHSNPAPAPVDHAGAAPSRSPDLVEFKSPLVGTFYRSPKPDAEPFVNPGDEVGPDKVLCVIEAMKVMNEIKAELTGIVREVLVKNGQAVEFGEILFLIEKK